MNEPLQADDIRALADDIFRDRVLRARQMPPDERIMDGPRLFDQACEIALSAIRGQHPEFTEDECQRELTRRIEIVRRLDETGLYYPVEDAE